MKNTISSFWTGESRYSFMNLPNIEVRFVKCSEEFENTIELVRKSLSLPMSSISKTFIKLEIFSPSAVVTKAPVKIKKLFTSQCYSSKISLFIPNIIRLEPQTYDGSNNFFTKLNTLWILFRSAVSFIAGRCKDVKYQSDMMSLIEF